MQNAFNVSSRLSEAEKFLKDGNYNYQRRPDGMLVVEGTIDLARRRLARLPDLGNVIVTGNFYCQDNNLTSLKGAPAEVRGGFWCNDNQLESLEYAPRGITGQFVCLSNRLTSLQHAPAEIDGDFCCGNNPLSLLEGAPKKFHRLYSDFGEFKSWDEVPEKLRLSPELRAQQIAAAAQDATVLGGNIQVSKPLMLKKPPAQ